MDEASINLLRDNLIIEEFYSLTQTHFMEIKKLMEEFEDEQMQLAINLKKYENEQIQSIEDFVEPNMEERSEVEGTKPMKEVK